jgi:RND family efflux transporter MFP subunit
MKFSKKLGWAAVIGVIGIVGVIAAGAGAAPAEDAPGAGAAASPEPESDPLVAQKPILTVTAVTPTPGRWSETFGANGNIAAWQEAVVGSELSGQRLAEVAVNVGDVVERGQLLARFADESVAADLAEARAALEEARAALLEAEANVARVRGLAGSGALSEQQKNAYFTAERAAGARVKSAQARLQMQEIRMRQTRVVAPDDGLISARSATLGAVPGQGEELFRLIRQNRLEWRAEVPADDLLRIRPGQPVALQLPGGAAIEGKVRIAGPAIDPATRNAIVYVDLPSGGAARAGLFVSGEFRLGESAAQTVPNSAVVMRDGHAYVFRIDEEQQVIRTRVEIGRRQDGRVEVLAGIDAGTRVVDHGAGFLADGDTVQVVATPAAPTAAAAAPSGR